MSATNSLPDWEDYLAQLKPLGALASTVQNHGDPQVRQETWKWLFAILGQAAIAGVHSDPSYPELVPVMNYGMNIFGPNPDFMYTWTPVTSEGSYRLRGFRNTARFVDLGFQRGWYPWEHNRGATVGMLNLDKLSLGPDTSFDVVVSKEPPAGYGGDWFQMPENTDNILVRSACCDWVKERDAVIAIERLDVAATRPRLSAEELSRRLSYLARWTELTFQRYQKWLQQDAVEKGLDRKLASYDYTDWGGVLKQAYILGLYKFEPGEAIILETDVPSDSRYWAWMLADDQFGTVDWMNRQSSLNDVQATLDSDGRFRGVIADEDPGIPNWMDTGGFHFGIIWGRWNHSSTTPVPTMKKVKLAELRKHLPADTPVVGREARDASLRQRRFGAQLRRKW